MRKRPIDDNKFYQMLAKWWGGEDNESVLDTRSVSLKMRADLRRQLNQYPVETKTENTLSLVNDISTNQIEIGGRISALNDGLKLMGGMAGKGREELIAADEILFAIQGFILLLIEFNEKTWELARHSSKKSESIMEDALKEVGLL